MEMSCHIWKVTVFDWSELTDRPLNPIGWSALVLLGALPEQEGRGRERERESAREREEESAEEPPGPKASRSQRPVQYNKKSTHFLIINLK